jgi:predicted permease
VQSVWIDRTFHSHPAAPRSPGAEGVRPVKPSVTDRVLAVMRTLIALTVSLWTDVRHGVRLLARSPLFAVVAIVSLATGVAASSAIFELSDALLLRPAPGVRDSAALVDIARSTNGSGDGPMAYPTFRFLRENARSFEGMAGTTEPTPLSLTDDNTTDRVWGQLVSWNYFDVLGIQPQAGRFFRPDEDTVPEARPAVVISARLWHQRFGSNPAAVGATVHINRVPFTVVGVTQERFDGASVIAGDMWIPMAMVGTALGSGFGDALTNKDLEWLRAVGRLTPGAGMLAAQSELNTLLGTFRTMTPEVPASHGVTLARATRVPGHNRWMALAAFFGLLTLIANGLLAIACSNVGGMLLARATTRRREMATRLAVGASRGQILRLLLVENLVLFAAAGLAALPLAGLCLAAIRASLDGLPFPLHLELSLSTRMLGFGAGVSCVAGVIFGLAPARLILSTRLSEALRGGAATPTRERQRLRHLLVVGQIALSLGVIVTAGLFVRTLRAAAAVDLGYQTRNVDIVPVDAALIGATASRTVVVADDIAERVGRIGGVEAVGYARMIPMVSGNLRLGRVVLPSSTSATDAVRDAQWDTVSPGYFSAVNLNLLQGRAFTAMDREGQPPVAIVNATFARLAFPGESAIGRRFLRADGSSDEGPEYEIAGVVENAKYQTVTEAAQPFVYVPFAQQPATSVQLFVRRSSDAPVAREIRAAVGSVDRYLPVAVHSFEEQVGFGLLPQRLAAWVSGGVGALGVVLSALGLYGLAVFVVEQRRREFAIRLALGATPGSVRGMVRNQAMRLGLIGGAVGLMLAFGLSKGVAHLGLLIGVTAFDPASFGAAAIAMGVVLLFASDRPARRAETTNPATVLRGE